MGASVLASKPEEILSEVERRRRWFEVGLMYVGMTSLTLAVGWLGVLWSPLASVSALFVAMGFMLLPTELLYRRGELPQNLGIGGRSDKVEESSFTRARRSFWQAGKMSLFVLPIYCLGIHIWHTYQGNHATWKPRVFSRWTEDVRGMSSTTLSDGMISFESRADYLKLSWRLYAHEHHSKFQIRLNDGSYQVLNRSRTARVTLQEKSQEPRDFDAGAVLEVSGRQHGWISLKTTASSMRISASIDGESISESRLIGGEFGSRLSLNSDQDIEIDRDMTWLWSILLIQLFLVGLPEEIFYRGYIQTRLDGLIGRDRIFWGVPFNIMSALICSVLFALAHLVTIPNPARLAVFFPSLLFGWMRRAYHDTLPPAIFHAICNVIAQLIWGIYAFG